MTYRLVLKAFAIYLLPLIVLLSPITSNAQDLRGPKIFGLQLGMSYNEARPILQKIAADVSQRHGKQIILKEALKGTPIGNDFVLITKAWIGNDISIECDETDHIKILHFTAESFDAEMNEGFIKAFMAKYDIPNLKQVGQNWYEYTNTKEGYQVKVFMVSGTILIYKIKTASEINFQ